MRTNVKKRIQFITLAIIVYTIGFNFIPEALAQTGQWQDLMPVIIASLGYFLLLPIFYWVLIIKGNQQKPWKMLLIFSMSGAMARFSYPESFAAYFEFLMWLKYPIIAVVVIFELYLMVTIIKGIWGARKLSGDPRLHTLKTYADDEKKLTAGLPFAWEPATWYYAIPRFSRNHLPSLPALNLSAASRWNYILSMSIIIFSGMGSYYALIGWSEIAALFVLCFILYCSVFVAARHRVARNYSLYISGDNLVINGSFWGISVVPLSTIETVQLIELEELVEAQSRIKANKAKMRASTESESSDENAVSETSISQKSQSTMTVEPLIFGKTTNEQSVKLSFSTPQVYHGMLGQFPEHYAELYLNVNNPQALLAMLKATASQDAA